MVGLLVALHGQHGTRARILGFLHGYTALAVGLSWVWNIFGPLSIMLWAVLAALTAAFAHFQGRAFLYGIRAAENARWMFVVATSGVSQIIDPHGHLHARLGAMEQGSIFGAVKRESRITFYTRFGWLLAWGVLGVAASTWIWLLIPARKRSAE